MMEVLGLFMIVLSDYTQDEIERAFARWFKNSTRFPLPADIVNIIERGGKPAFEKSVYIALQEKVKNCAAMVTSDEWIYIKDYEKYMISGEY